MGLSKNITLTIKDYEIKLDKQIKFYENDTINLCFSILEYGIEVKNGVSINKLMPIQALRSYMLIETPQGIDYAESTIIENNKIVFNLGSKYSRFVGIGHMQIVIKDSDGCRVTLPEFEFEIKKSINTDWDRDSIFLVTEDDSIIIDEFGREIHMSKISDMPISENLSEESYVMIIDEEGNKRFKVKAIADAVEDSLDTKFNAYADEMSGDVERIKGEVNEISESLDNITQRVTTIEENGTGTVTTNSVEPSDYDVPKIFFTSSDMLTLNSKEDGEKIVELEYVSKTKKFKSYATVAIQGTTSATFPKKNYTLKLYKDSDISEQEYLNIKDWGKQTKFCLKANYVDTTHTRNIAGARIAYDMVESRPSSAFKTSLQTAPRNGLIDGFPIKVFVNGLFHGIYTWNIPKDTWAFNNPQMVLCAERNNDGSSTTDDVLRCEFRKEWDGSDGNSWSIESGTLTTELKDSFNRCVNFVMTASDTEFHDNINQYFDLYSLLDYYCFAYFTCHLDGLAKNMLMITYDGIIWGASLYDMDSLFGAWYDGTSFKPTNYQCPEQFQETNSLLWQRIENCFGQELYTRYQELRKGALSLGNIVSHVEQIYDLITDRDISEEQAKWSGLPSKTTNTIARFRNYMNDRAGYVDGEFKKLIKEPDTTTEYILYQLNEPFQSDGISTYLDTGVKLYDTDTDWTIICKHNTIFDVNSGDNDKVAFYLSCWKESSPTYGFLAMCNKESNVNSYNVGNKNLMGRMNDGSTVFAIKKNGTTYTLFDNFTRLDVPVTVSSNFTSLDCTLLVGAMHNADFSPFRHVNLIINNLVVYSKALSDDEMKNKIAELK